MSSVTNNVNNSNFVAIPVKEKSVEERICSICFDTLQGEELPTCRNNGHSFHATCIDPWLIQNSICPLCREPWFEPKAGEAEELLGEPDFEDDFDYDEQEEGLPAAPPPSPREPIPNYIIVDVVDNVPIGMMNAPLSPRYYREFFQHLNRQQQQHRNMTRAINTIALLLGALIIAALFRVI